MGMKGSPRPERAAPYQRSCRILYDLSAKGPSVVKRARAAIPAAMQQMLSSTCTAACRGSNEKSCVRDEADAAERARAIRKAGEAAYSRHPKRPGKPHAPRMREREPSVRQRNPFAPPEEKQRELLLKALGGSQYDDPWYPRYR